MPRSLSERVGLRNNIFANKDNGSTNAPSPPKEQKGGRNVAAAHETIDADRDEHALNVK